MGRFLKIEGESFWVNLDRIDALVVRPQLLAVGGAQGPGALEELHEATGNYEVAVAMHGQLSPVRIFATRAEAEAYVQTLLDA